MKISIYYLSVIVANISVAYFRSEWIRLDFGSVLPIVLTGLMIFQALYFKYERTDKGFETAYDSNYSYEQLQGIYDYTVISYLAAIPLMFPFILFFTMPLKLISVLIYVLSVGAGGLVYRIRNRKNIINEIERTKEELKDQKRKEELGKWR